MRLPARSSRGFTLVELIVAIVILAVLAAIAVPTFSSVIARSHDESAEISLAAYAREVQAHAAFDQSGSLEQRHFEESGAGMEMADAPGTSAASLKVRALPAPINAARSVPDGVTVFSYALAADGQTAGLTAISAANHCVALTMTLTTTTPHPISTDPETCHALNISTGDVASEPEIGFAPDTKVAPNSPLSAPALARKAVTTADVTVAWSSIPNVTGYRVQISSSPNMSAATDVDVKMVREYLVSLEPGVTKYVTAVAVRGSQRSNPSDVLPVMALPAAPSSASAVVDDVQVTVSWAPVPGAAGYYVYQDGSDTITATAVGGSTTSSVFTLGNGQSATFVVRAYNAGGISDASPQASALTVPVAPTNVRVDVVDTTVTLTWDESPTADGYYVYQDGSGTFTHTVLGGSTVTTTFTLAPGQTASYVLRAYNSGGVSKASAPAVATAIPVAPSNLRASLSGHTVTLTWDETPKSNGYHVYRSGVSTIAGTVVGGSTTTTTFTLVDGETASYVVRAYNDAGVGAASNSASVTVVPAVPTVTASNITNTTATYSWTASSGTTRYEYELRQNGGAWEPTRNLGTAVSTQAGPTTTGNRLESRVRACNDGGCSAWSGISSAQLTMNLSWFLSNGWVNTNPDFWAYSRMDSGMRANCPSGTFPQFRIRDDGTRNAYDWWGWSHWWAGDSNGAHSSDTAWWQSGALYGGTTHMQWQAYCRNPGSGAVSQTYQWNTEGHRAMPAAQGMYLDIIRYRTAGWGASCPAGTTPHYRYWKWPGYNGGGFSAYIDWTTGREYYNGNAWGSPGDHAASVWCRSDAYGSLGPEVHVRDVF